MVDRPKKAKNSSRSMDVFYKSNIEPNLVAIEEWATYNTQKEIAVKLGIALSTFKHYMQVYRPLRQAVKTGNTKKAEGLRKSLITLALGFNSERILLKKTKELEDGTIETEVHEKTTIAPNLKAITILLANEDSNFHTNPDDYKLKEKALKIREEKTQTKEDEWVLLTKPKQKGDE